MKVKTMVVIIKSHQQVGQWVGIQYRPSLLWTKLKNIVTSKLSPAPNALFDDWSNVSF